MTNIRVTSRVYQTGLLITEIKDAQVQFCNDGI